MKKGKTIRFDEGLLTRWCSTYGSELLPKFIEQSLNFSLRGKEYFSLIFWQEYSKVILNNKEI